MKTRGPQFTKGILLLALWTVMVSTTQAGTYSGGTGEPNDPYQIATAQDLIDLGNEPNDYDKHFILTADIDLSGYAFDRAVIAPVSIQCSRGCQLSSEETFQGVFDGDGHVIYNLTIDRSAGGGGLMGGLGRSGCISNLGLEQANVTGASSDSSTAGVLVGWNEGSVFNCYSIGQVNGQRSVGGLIGTNKGSISASYSTCTISGYWCVGGLVGYNSGSITASTSIGSVSGVRHVGGLVGENYEGLITASYSIAATEGGDSNVGGLVGWNGKGVVVTSYSAGEVSGRSNVGGLVGGGSGLIVASFWDVETSGIAEGVNGIGRSTAQMQNMETFLDAGWDWVDETANGTAGFWQMQEGDYPQLACMEGSVPLEPQGGGSAEDPYLIYDVNELGTIWYRSQAHYRLTRSIDLSGITWNKPVVPVFDGGFDGNDCTISHLSIRGGSHLGLVGILSPIANISNLGLELVDVNGTDDKVGGLVGMNSGSITSSYSTGVVCGGSNVGGLVGENDEGNVMLSYSIVSVSGDDNIGGLVGGDKLGTIASSYSGGTVNGDDYVGGLVGVSSGLIRRSCSEGSVSGDCYLGGLIGSSYGSIISSYSKCNVRGEGYRVGGLVGLNSGEIASSYSSGTVRGEFWIGGLVAYDYLGSVTSSFWDVETSGTTTSDGGLGLTTTQMHDIDTYLDVGWDFVGETVNGPNDIWFMLENDYPQLVQ